LDAKKAKLILQELWKCQVEWDDVVQRDIQIAWVNFQSQLQKIHRITIPRRVTIDDTVNLQLHGFADANERAYGACIYLRSTDRTNKHQTHLLCSKSRVAPLKT
jgi:bisphosphoglycerate-dependent phosphoglycerate mutase